MPIRPSRVTPNIVRPSVVRPNVVTPSRVFPSTVLPAKVMPSTVVMQPVEDVPEKDERGFDKVESSFIGSIGYDPTGGGSGDVYVFMYTSNRTYCYQGVAEHVFKEFLKAPSKGKFYNANIKYAYPWRAVA
jgi:hypothetical protein